MEDLNGILREMKAHGMRVPEERVHISIYEAKAVLRNAMRFFIAREGREMQWLPEYENVAEWLSDNKGRGLFLFGNCGRGKTLLSRYVIPAILLKYQRRVVSYFDAQELNERIDEALTKKIVSVDDIGTEEVLVSYGNRRLAFLELADAVEKNGKLLIVTSNLNHEQLINKYGDRTLERVLATTKRVLFTGKSMRV